MLLPILVIADQAWTRDLVGYVIGNMLKVWMCGYPYF